MKRKSPRLPCTTIAMRKALVALTIVLRRAGFYTDLIGQVIEMAERNEAAWLPADLLVQHAGAMGSLHSVSIKAPPNMYWPHVSGKLVRVPWGLRSKVYANGSHECGIAEEVFIHVGYAPRHWLDEQIDLATINLVYY